MPIYSEIHKNTALEDISVDHASVHILPDGVQCYAVYDGLECRIYKSSREEITGFALDVAEALAMTAQYLQRVQGSGLTHPQQMQHRSGTQFDIVLTDARGARNVAARLADWQEWRTRQEPGQTAAVILTALPVPVISAGKDTVDHMTRRAHLCRALDSMGELDAMRSPYPLIRLPFMMKGSPWTGHASARRASNTMLWNQAYLVTCQSNNPALVVHNMQAWARGRSGLTLIDRATAVEFINNDTNDI